MKRVKKPKSKKKPVTLTQRQLKEYTRQVSDESVTRSICLFIAYMMSEKEIEFDSERIIELVDGITRWTEAVDEHLISIRQVAAIIEEHTGLRLDW